jgi:molybdate transport system substrate-binding protein
MKKTLTRILVLSLFFGATWSAQAQEITVSAAASLTNAFTDIAKNFEKANPQHRVLLNFAGSGALLQQIAKGAPVDIFASADSFTMNQASAKNLIVENSRFDFVANSLVVISAVNSPLKLTQLKDLTKKEVQRLALGNPDSVPVGRYSKTVLEQEKLWPELENKIIQTQNVRQSLDYVARGEVDAGFVYATDAALMADKVQVRFSVPTSEAILYPISLTQTGKANSAAQDFLIYLKSSDSMKVFKQYGFSAAN